MTPVSWERRLIRRNGEIFWEASHAGFERDVHDRPDRMMGVVQDITDRVRLVEDLRGSRARIVEAGARERLRLERDLHDGAQNRLVAIQIKLGLARDQAGAGAVATRLDEIIEDVEAAIDELRALGHGIYPNELRTEGLGQALRSLAAAAPVRVHVIADAWAATRRRSSKRCSSASAKRSRTRPSTPARTRTSRSSSSAATTASSSRSATTDPGSIRASSRDGFGLASMRDRIAAIGGELEIISAPGQGARVRGIVPKSATPSA